MLMRIVPARDFNRSAHHGARERPATWSQPAPIPLDAERRPSDYESTDQVLLTERKLGVFDRRITLDRAAGLDRADAALDAGVLTMRVPIAAEPTSRTIPITHS